MRRAHVTTISDPNDVHLQDHLTREEAAMMFVALDKAANPQHVITQKTCTRSDSPYINASYQSAVQEACQRGIMRGSAGKFFPRAPLTTAESVAMLARMHQDTVAPATT